MKTGTGTRKTSGLGRPLPYLAAAFACTFLESVPAFDSLAQQPFFQHGAWLLSRSFHNEYTLLLYTGPKILIGLIGGVFFLLFLASVFSNRFKARLRAWREPALLVALSIILVPLLAATLKAVSGVHSPVDMLPYGGRHPHTGLLEHLWLFGKTAGGRSFPAGHASGGFALMALYSLPLKKGLRTWLSGFGFFAGWGMGLYQMARGEHFLSHTLTTLFLALAVITCLARLLSLSEAYGTADEGSG